MDYLASLAIIAVEGTAAVLLHSAWLNWRREKPRFVPALLLFTVLCFCFVYLYNGGLTGKIFLPVIWILLWGLLFWRGAFLPRLMVAVTYLAANNCLECLAIAILSFLTGAQAAEMIGGPLLFFAGAGINKGLLILLSLYLYRMVRHTQSRRRNWADWLLLLLPVLGLSLFSLLFIQYFWDVGLVSRQLTLTVAVFAATTVLYFVQKLGAENARQSAELYKNQQQELLQQNREQRAILHDTTNFSLTIGSLLENGRQDQALALVRQLTERCSTAPTRIHTGNPTADAVLNDQCSKAAAQGIELFVLVCSLKNLTLSELDTVVVLSNLLDNARNACMACPDVRRISIQAVPLDSRQVRLTVRNTCPPPPSPQPARRPAARAGLHGYGQKNVQKVMEKYGGACLFGQEGDWYRALLLLPCPSDDPNDA